MPKKSKRLLITAGPTREMLDPVRFISNLSTGHMGYTLARVAKKKGYRVTLITGPTGLKKPKGILVVPITSVADLKKACAGQFFRHDALIMTAAVCDFTAKLEKKRKIKRSQSINVSLKQTPDIVAGLAKRKGERTVVGFCLETEDWLKKAKQKMSRKNLDGIVANYYTARHTPFGNRKINTAFLAPGRKTVQLKGVSKSKVAERILLWMETLQKSVR